MMDKHWNKSLCLERFFLREQEILWFNRSCDLVDTNAWNSATTFLKETQKFFYKMENAMSVFQHISFLQ